jgi:hypothetical protein
VSEAKADARRGPARRAGCCLPARTMRKAPGPKDRGRCRKETRETRHRTSYRSGLWILQISRGSAQGKRLKPTPRRFRFIRIQPPLDERPRASADHVGGLKSSTRVADDRDGTAVRPCRRTSGGTLPAAPEPRPLASGQALTWVDGCGKRRGKSRRRKESRLNNIAQAANTARRETGISIGPKYFVHHRGPRPGTTSDVGRAHAEPASRQYSRFSSPLRFERDTCRAAAGGQSRPESPKANQGVTGIRS